jgi:hypothetical protein
MGQVIVRNLDDEVILAHKQHAKARGVRSSSSCATCWRRRPGLRARSCGDGWPHVAR